MNNFLILVIILMGGAGIYEYTNLEQQLQRATAQELTGITGESGKVENLQVEMRKRDAENAQLTKNLADAQVKITDLTQQLQESKKAMEDIRLAALATADAANNPNKDKNKPPAPPAPPPVIKLGTIATQDGKTYNNCILLKVEPDGITFSHSAGITKVMFPFLPLELQKRFGHHDQMPDPDAIPDTVPAMNDSTAPAPAN
jgi:hypothetical protein